MTKNPLRLLASRRKHLSLCCFAAFAGFAAQTFKAMPLRGVRWSPSETARTFQALRLRGENPYSRAGPKPEKDTPCPRRKHFRLCGFVVKTPIPAPGQSRKKTLRVRGANISGFAASW